MLNKGNGEPNPLDLWSLARARTPTKNNDMTKFEELLMYGLQAVKDDPDILGDENCFFFTSLRTKLLECVRKQIIIDAEEVSLTWKDVRLLESVLEEMLGDRTYGICSSGISNEQYSKEALRRFKERKVMDG